MMKDFWASQSIEITKFIEYAENSETWTIDSVEFQTCLDIFCKRLKSSACKSPDSHFIKVFMEVLAVAKFSYFVRILKNAEEKNSLLIENLVSSITNNEIPLAVSQILVCRTRYLITIGIYNRVFSSDRLRLILQSLGN